MSGRSFWEPPPLFGKNKAFSTASVRLLSVEGAGASTTKKTPDAVSDAGGLVLQSLVFEVGLEPLPETVTRPRGQTQNITLQSTDFRVFMRLG